MTYEDIRRALIAHHSPEALLRALLDYAALERQADALLLAAVRSGAPAADIVELVEGQRLMLAGHLTGLLGAMQLWIAAQRSPALAAALEQTPLVAADGG